MQSKPRGSAQFPARGSGRFEPRQDTRVGRLLLVLAPYVARISAAAVVKGSMARLGVFEATMTPDQLERVVADVMLGLRLFCDPSKLPELMVDLALLCDQEHAGE